ncbi:MAG TPA: cupin domain-containing protein [Vicinamibacterales bacterium]|jgi:anti-sigma factor ChrR (cupin superfamily)
MTEKRDDVEFDDIVAMGLAAAAGGPSAPGPRPEVRDRLLRLLQTAPAPPGFQFMSASDDQWLPHPVPGIRMKILALNRSRGYATLLLDVAAGTRFPAHHHVGAEECFVVSGSLYTCGRRLEGGDFVHADPDTDHGELYTDEGCRVILVVPPEEHLSPEMMSASFPQREP